MGFKAALRDFPVLAPVLQMSAAAFDLPSYAGLSKQHGGRTLGTPGSPAYGGQVLGEEAPPRRPFLPRPRAGLAGKTAPATSSLWFGANKGTQRRVGALVGPGGPRGTEGHCAVASPRPGPAGSRASAPHPASWHPLTPATRGGGDLPNLRFLNKAPHIGKALRVCAAPGAGRPGRVVVCKGTELVLIQSLPKQTSLNSAHHQAAPPPPSPQPAWSRGAPESPQACLCLMAEPDPRAAHPVPPPARSWGAGTPHGLPRARVGGPSPRERCRSGECCVREGGGSWVGGGGEAPSPQHPALLRDTSYSQGHL